MLAECTGSAIGLLGRRLIDVSQSGIAASAGVQRAWLSLPVEDARRPHESWVPTMSDFARVYECKGSEKISNLQGKHPGSSNPKFITCWF